MMLMFKVLGFSVQSLGLAQNACWRRTVTSGLTFPVSQGLVTCRPSFLGRQRQRLGWPQSG